MNRIKATFLFLSLFFGSLLHAQPSYIYEGGIGNGYSSAVVIDNNNVLFIGGAESAIYSGEKMVNNNILYIGGEEGAVYSNVKTVNNNILFIGGFGNGIHSSIKSTNNNVLFIGGVEDGYASFYDKKDFIWTGTIGQSWSVPGNWNYNVVPDINRRTIIPTGVPHYPHVNAGLFAIGENPNNGAYKSGELIILPGALLVTRINCRVENYGLIQIEGHMNVKREASNAFTNLMDGQVKVMSGGLFSFQ